MFDAGHNNSISQALERDAQRLRPEDIRPVEAHNLRDIITIIKEFDPARQKEAPPITLDGEITGVNNDGRRFSIKFHSTNEQKTKRQYIIEAFDAVDRLKQVLERQEKIEPIEINDKLVYPAKVPANPKLMIDNVVRFFFGAYREDKLICWNIEGLKYKYDIFNHKLFKDADEN